jgi:hypothetical protein
MPRTVEVVSDDSVSFLHKTTLYRRIYIGRRYAVPFPVRAAFNRAPVQHVALYGHYPTMTSPYASIRVMPWYCWLGMLLRQFISDAIRRLTLCYQLLRDAFGVEARGRSGRLWCPLISRLVGDGDGYKNACKKDTSNGSHGGIIARGLGGLIKLHHCLYWQRTSHSLWCSFFQSHRNSYLHRHSIGSL